MEQICNYGCNETDLDRCKWSQFTNELIIFKKD